MAYKFPCGEYLKVYVGQTGRTLSHRLKEHRTALTSGSLTQFAMAEHVAAHNHATDWGSVKVGDTHHQFQQRCLLKSRHIRFQKAIWEVRSPPPPCTTNKAQSLMLYVAHTNYVSQLIPQAKFSIFYNKVEYDNVLFRFHLVFTE